MWKYNHFSNIIDQNKFKNNKEYCPICSFLCSVLWIIVRLLSFFSFSDFIVCQSFVILLSVNLLSFYCLSVFCHFIVCQSFVILLSVSLLSFYCLSVFCHFIVSIFCHFIVCQSFVILLFVNLLSFYCLSIFCDFIVCQSFVILLSVSLFHSTFKLIKRYSNQ